MEEREQKLEDLEQPVEELSAEEAEKVEGGWSFGAYDLRPTESLSLNFAKMETTDLQSTELNFEKF
jgi:hypothetical protein